MNSSTRQRQLVILGSIVAVVVVVIGIAIALSGSRPAANIDFSSIPQSRGADGAFVLGNPDAPITIVEFADFACPYCQAYQPTITEFIQRYVVTGQAKFEYRTFPTAGGQLTVFNGQLSECAEEQRPGAFWEAYKVFYELSMNSQYNDQAGRIAAERLDLNYSELLSCTADAGQVDTDVTFGRNRGVSGTPAIMVRYGDSDAEWISYSGTVYNRGTVPLDVLSSVVTAAQ